MTENNLKLIISKYRKRTGIALMFVVLLLISFDYYHVSHYTKLYTDAGMQVPSHLNLFNWGYILTILYVLLQLVFYSIEKIFIEVVCKQQTKLSEDNL